MVMFHTYILTCVNVPLVQIYVLLEIFSRRRQKEFNNNVSLIPITCINSSIEEERMEMLAANLLQLNVKVSAS